MHYFVLSQQKSSSHQRLCFILMPFLFYIYTVGNKSSISKTTHCLIFKISMPFLNYFSFSCFLKPIFSNRFKFPSIQISKYLSLHLHFYYLLCSENICLALTATCSSPSQYLGPYLWWPAPSAALNVYRALCLLVGDKIGVLPSSYLEQIISLRDLMLLLWCSTTRNSTDAKESGKKVLFFFSMKNFFSKNIFDALGFSVKHRKSSPEFWPSRKALVMTSPFCTVLW